MVHNSSKHQGVAAGVSIEAGFTIPLLIGPVLVTDTATKIRKTNTKDGDEHVGRHIEMFEPGFEPRLW